MAKVKKCFLCRAENLAKEFERNHQQGTLTMFKVTVDRAVEAVAKDANYFDVQPCKHAVAQWPDNRYLEPSGAFSAASIAPSTTSLTSTQLKPPPTRAGSRPVAIARKASPK